MERFIHDKIEKVLFNLFHFKMLYVVTSKKVKIITEGEEYLKVFLEVIPDISFISKERMQEIKTFQTVDGQLHRESIRFPKGITMYEMSFFRAHLAIAKGNASFSSIFHLFLNGSEDEIKSYFNESPDSKIEVPLIVNYKDGSVKLLSTEFQDAV